MDIQKVKIVADSSSDVLSLDRIAFESAPLKIITTNKEYIDNENLDVKEMVDDLQNYKGKSSTSCPNPGDWLETFGDAEFIFCLTITGTLSGSYNSACIAKEIYEEKNPQRKVFVINSLSTGPELKLFIEKIEELILEGDSFENVCKKIMEYSKRTGLLFMLQSMKNLANNGRVNPLVAKVAGLMGIRVIGKASDKGDLEQLSKRRGTKSTLECIVNHMKSLGFNGGKVRIAHCLNETEGNLLKNMIKQKFEKAKVILYECRALCSFYAEKGGLLIGFEKEIAM